MFAIFCSYFWEKGINESIAIENIIWNYTNWSNVCYSGISTEFGLFPTPLCTARGHLLQLLMSRWLKSGFSNVRIILIYVGNRIISTLVRADKLSSLKSLRWYFFCKLFFVSFLYSHELSQGQTNYLSDFLTVFFLSDEMFKLQYFNFSRCMW